MKPPAVATVIAAAIIILLFTAPATSFAAPAAQAGSSYIVKAGDTLSGIASRYGVTVAALRSANGISGSFIYPGQRLAIPSGSSGSPSYGATSGSSTAPQSPSGGQYVVGSGDSLSSIAARHGISLAALKGANGLSGDRIYVGQTLTIPAGGGSGMPAQSYFPSTTYSQDSGGSSGGGCGGTYVVKRSDTLSAIAARCGTTVSELMSANRLASSVVWIGQVLSIPSAAPTFQSTPFGVPSPTSTPQPTRTPTAPWPTWEVYP